MNTLNLNPNRRIMIKSRKLLFTFFCLILVYSTHAASFTNTRSGSWYDPTIWDLGRIPATLDLVTIAANTTVTVYGDYTDCDGLTINGFLDVGPTNLTIGGRDLQIDVRAVRIASCIINGGLKITGDWSHQFKVYGHVKFNTGSTFEMSAGTIMIDGSGFTEELSIPAHIPLLDVTDASSFSSTGGMIVMFNPHYHPTGLTIKGAKHFHSVSFGNNLTLPNFACRHTSDFLISDTDKPTFKNVRLAYLPNPNRQNLVVLNNVSISENLELSNGVLVGDGRFKVAGNILIGTDGRIERDIECNGSWQQNITTFMSNTSATIKGNLFINNPDRVQTAINLDIQNGTINMIKGKFDLKDKTVSVAVAPTTAMPTSYIVTYNQYSNVGTLVVKNLSGQTLFPVGTETSYLPVTLTASGGDFSVSARPLSIAVNNGSYSIDNQWDINRTSGTSTADIGVQWNTTNESTNFATYRTNAKLHRFDGNTWQPLSNTNVSTLNNSVIATVAQNIQNFSTFTMLTQAPVPVTLKSFVGKIVENNTLLVWETASEFNNVGFDIEKSTNGADFSNIGFVKGAGSSFQLNTYNFIDKNFNQTAYYRLKQLDFDGKYAYSPVVALQKTVEKGNVKIYPNPVSDQPFLTIDISENSPFDTNIAIFESNGRQIYLNAHAKDQTTIPVSDWANGIYFIRLTTNEGKTAVSKFVKK